MTTTLRELLKEFCSKQRALKNNILIELVTNINKLPEEEKAKHEEYIDKIVDVINEINTSVILSVLTPFDRKKFNVLIHEILRNLKHEKNGTDPPSPSYVSEGNDALFGQHLIKQMKTFASKPREIEKPLVSEMRSPETMRKHLGSNPYIVERLLLLIHVLGSDSITSTLNVYVQEYLDSINILIEELAEYDETLNTIEQCLIKHKWEKNNFTEPPDQKKLCDDLRDILTHFLF